MEDISLWKAGTHIPVSYPPLSQDLDVDVAIVGGGITGITTALALINSGKQVAVFENNKIGGVVTSRSTGNLYTMVQPYYHQIEKKFDLETAKTIAVSRRNAITYIEKVVKELDLACGFVRRPWYMYTEDEEGINLLDKEIEVFKKMQIPFDYVNEMSMPIKFKQAALMPDQARVNPLQYVISIAESLKEKGVQIFENTRIVSHEEGDHCTLKTAQGNTIRAKKIVLATHTPIGFNPVQVFTAPYRSYVLAVLTKENVYPEGQFWKVGRSHYVSATHGLGDKANLFLMAGSHHRTGQGKDMLKHYAELEEYLKATVEVEKILYRWSAQHFHSADDVPYIGLATRTAKNTYMGTGYFADGLVYGTIAGIILAELVTEQENQQTETYRANRTKLFASAGFLMKESGNLFLQYLAYLPTLKTANYDDIKRGEGRLVAHGLKKRAVYRDENNNLHILSPVCTHMKCIVNWNDAEKTWDCPCHGSRYTAEGRVLEGPAMQDLKPDEE